MPSFNQQLDAIINGRKSSERAAGELYSAKVNALKQNASISTSELANLVNTQREAENAAKINLRESVKSLYAENSQQSLIANWDSKIPILLLPLRLETRFMDLPDGKQELWLRIYPDDIAVQQHETLLSEKEFAAGKNYWIEMFAAEKSATDGETQKQNAWQHLKNIFEPMRSVWIARQTIPSNWPTRNLLNNKEQLVFAPMPLLKSTEWTMPPKTQILPDKFVVSIFKGPTKVHEQEGNLLPDTLMLGHDPFQGSEAFTKTEFGISFSKEFSWMSDFEEAVTIGMGLKIPLNTDMYLDPNNRLIDRITVLGVFISADPVQSQQMLADLLEDHRFTSGLAIIPQGTATNNTENSSSGYTKNEDPQPKGYFEAPADLASEKVASDGSRLSNALGIDENVIKGISNYDCRDHAEAVVMNKALFPATIGYYFDTLLDRVIENKYVSILRKFFVHQVTGAGPLPAIRIGDQPYGVLVTSDFSKWVSSMPDADQNTFYNQLLTWLRFFSEQWESQTGNLQFIGKQADNANRPLNPEDVFLDVVGLEPSSVYFERRTGLSNDLAGFRRGWNNLPEFERQSSRYERNLRDQIERFGGRLPGDHFLFTSLLFRSENKVHIPEKNLLDGLPDDETRRLPDIPQIGKNYLAWLRDVIELVKLQNQDMAGAKVPNYLLYLLARHSLLLELRSSALAILAKNNSFIRPSAFDKTFINFMGRDNSQRDLTIWEILYADLQLLGLPSTNPLIKTLGDHLLNGDSENIKSLKAKFDLLSGLPTSRLERLLTGHLDTLTYRLDAWQSGLFYDRLELNRTNVESPVKGIYLGAFGFLEQLKPASKTIVPADRLPKSLKAPDNNPIFSQADSAGLLHAPSLDHAAAAALLLTGYRNNVTAEEPAAFAVNLSSSRIRKAMQVLEGIRNGQSLEALLGYQFERACHESTIGGVILNQFILAFRNHYRIEHQYNPQEGEQTNPDDVFRPVPYPVVNGLKLTKEPDRNIFKTIMTGANAGPVNTSQIERVNQIANELGDTLDALKDLLLSESVFQAASGNTARTGAVLESLREGNLPPDPEIIKTPRRSRFAFNHVLSIHFPQVSSVISPWAGIPLSPAAHFEPGLNIWLGKIIGDPSLITCSATHLSEESTTPFPKRIISFADLKMQPMDILSVFGKESGETYTEVERVIAYHYRKLTGINTSQVVQIDLSDKGNSVGKSVIQVLPMLRAISAAFGQARPIHAGDYRPFRAGQPTTTGVDVNDLQNRVNVLIKQFSDAITELTNVVALTTASPLTNEVKQKIIVARVTLSNFDLPNAWPNEIPDESTDNIATFISDTTQLLKVAQETLANASAISASAADGIEEEKVALLSKLVKLLLKPNFPVMPKFRFDQPAEIKSAFNDTSQLLKSYSEFSGLPPSIIPDDWLHSVAEVRSKTRQWELARMLAETHSSTELTLHPMQLPYRPNDSWIAVQFPKTIEATGKPFEITTDTLSCTVVWPEGGSIETLQSGLMLDEWSETIPVDKETTGVAFHYNQPDAMPPQSLLLAVYPGLENNWSWDILLGTITDTFKRAKMRAVEPRHLQNNQVVQHFLSGVIAPINLGGSNITLDFAVASDEFLSKVPRGVAVYDPHINTQATVR